MKTINDKDKFQVAVDYLCEYSGVKIAVISDSEGLPIAQSSPEGLDGSDLAGLGLEMIRKLDIEMDGLVEPGCELISFKTKSEWVTIIDGERFSLLVIAERRVDDLLNVRIQKSIDMITNHFKEKYQAFEPIKKKSASSVKKLEDTHV